MQGAIPINDTGLGVSYNAATGNALSAYYDSITHQHAARASLSYVTGSHAIKAGYVEQFGTWQRNQFSYTDYIVRLNNGAPTSVVLSATPQNASYDMNADLGLFVQDQWRVGRITLNGGLRFDYFNTSIPAQSAPAGKFVAARNFPEIKNVPNWKDISPRIGGVWDVFGTGKTALKASVSRYLAAQTAAFAQSVNPMTALATDTRTWTDPNKDGIPQPSEFGPSTNATFGLPVFGSHPDPAVSNGWGARGANWEYAGGIQHEIAPGVSGSVLFTRRSYRNITWTKNTLVTASDYAPFTVNNPYTNTPLTLYNQSAATRALVDNLVTFAPDDQRVFNGVDFVANGKYRKLLMYGGITMGTTHAKICTVGTINPNSLINCDMQPALHCGDPVQGAPQLFAPGRHAVERRVREHARPAYDGKLHRDERHRRPPHHTDPDHGEPRQARQPVRRSAERTGPAAVEGHSRRAHAHGWQHRAV